MTGLLSRKEQKNLEEKLATTQVLLSKANKNMCLLYGSGKALVMLNPLCSLLPALPGAVLQATDYGCITGNAGAACHRGYYLHPLLPSYYLEILYIRSRISTLSYS